MRVLILGLNHQIQPRDIRSWGSDGRPQAFERDQKERFIELLREKLDIHQIEFVGEETKHGEESIVQAICRGGCTYSNIEMTPEERTAREIPAGYNENPDVPEAQRAAWNLEREEYMANRVLAQPDAYNRVFVICGRQHSAPLAELLRGQGHEVEIDDLLNYEWYVEDWMGHIMHNL